MKTMTLIKSLGVVLISTIIFNTRALAEDVQAKDSTSKPVIKVDATMGKHYFEGSKRFVNGGPACITCHNVNDKNMIPGGVLAKDLTEVYDRMGEGIKDWLVAPPFPAMTASYKTHPLSEKERMALTAYFKRTNENKEKSTANSATNYFLFGGIAGLGVILVIINILWFKRKKDMVKQDIFKRQSKAWDAKY